MVLYKCTVGVRVIWIYVMLHGWPYPLPPLPANATTCSITLPECVCFELHSFMLHKLMGDVHAMKILFLVFY